MKILVDENELITMYCDGKLTNFEEKQYMFKIALTKSDKNEIECSSIRLKAEEFLPFTLRIPRFAVQTVCEYIEKLCPELDIEKHGINMNIATKDGETALRIGNSCFTKEELVNAAYNSDLIS